MRITRFARLAVISIGGGTVGLATTSRGGVGVKRRKGVCGGLAVLSLPGGCHGGIRGLATTSGIGRRKRRIGLAVIFGTVGRNGMVGLAVISTRVGRVGILVFALLSTFAGGVGVAGLGVLYLRGGGVGVIGLAVY